MIKNVQLFGKLIKNPKNKKEVQEETQKIMIQQIILQLNSEIQQKLHLNHQIIQSQLMNLIDHLEK